MVTLGKQIEINQHQEFKLGLSRLILGELESKDTL